MSVDFVPGTVSAAAPPRTRVQIGAWLLLCAVLVLSVTVLGGVTRLTHSGLSMVTWEPLAGILPPLSVAAWEAEFANYRQFPEYLLLNRGMDLAGFKSIFWFEYSHRLLARTIGLVYAVPFFVFLLLRRFERPFAWKLFGLLLLGGMQGVLGWLMVASGLVDRPDVSHYRLTAHLGLAVLIFVAMIWLALRVLLPRAVGGIGVPPPGRFRRAAFAVAASVYLLILTGGLVAGLDAGFAYNTFPTMDGVWVPAGVFAGNPFESVEGVQFLHRWLGALVIAGAILLWGRALDLRLPAAARWAFHGLAATIVAQGLLGILTLLRAVPVSLGALHQGMALLVLAAAVAAAYAAMVARVPPKAGIIVVE